MLEDRPLSRQACVSLYADVAPVTRITFEDLARLPARRLARLLLDRAAEDPTLLGRLYDFIDRECASVAAAPIAAHDNGGIGKSILGKNIVGQSGAMRRVAGLINRFELTDDPILITGESGIGKGLVAQAIHKGSRRGRGPFVALNCAAIPSSLVASELLGHEKGAFTGATVKAWARSSMPTAGHFLQIASAGFSRPIDGFTPDAMVTLLTYHWPGNVREMMSVIRRATAVSDRLLIDTVNLTELSESLRSAGFRDSPRVAAVLAGYRRGALPVQNCVRPKSA